jgi:vacuolar-type H+-ATPase subunit H
MEKARVLEVFKVDDQAYQSTCSAIGLKNPAALIGTQLEQFDRVRNWLDSKEVKNFKEASDRFKAEAKATADKKPSAPTEEVVQAFDAVTEAKAEAAVETALNVVDDAAQSLEETLVVKFYGHVLKRFQSPEIQARLRQSRKDNSNTLEGEITVDIPALPVPQS